MPYDNSAVRRQDRLLDEARARELLAGSRFGVLSLVDGDGAYGIPVNYVWDGDDSLYVHCAPDGASSAASTAVTGCRSASWGLRRCVRRSSRRLTRASCSTAAPAAACRPGERMRALELLLEKYSPAHKTTGLRYAEASFARTEIVRLDVVAWSGKTKRVH